MTLKTDADKNENIKAFWYTVTSRWPPRPFHFKNVLSLGVAVHIYPAKTNVQLPRMGAPYNCT